MVGVGFEDGPPQFPTPGGSVSPFPYSKRGCVPQFPPPSGDSGPQFPHHRRALGLNFPTPQRMPDGFDSVPLKTSSSSTNQEL